MRIAARRFVLWQPISMAITPNGCVYFPSDCGEMADSTPALFVHEMAHVWQHQQGQGVFWRGLALQTVYYASLCRFDPYALPVGPWRYDALNLEQQAQFVTRTLFPDAVWYRA